MAESSNEGKKAKKPSGNLEGINVTQGQEQAASSKGEVTGHMSPGAIYLCWNDTARNLVPAGWVYFYCWRCGALNQC